MGRSPARWTPVALRHRVPGGPGCAAGEGVRVRRVLGTALRWGHRHGYLVTAPERLIGDVHWTGQREVQAHEQGTDPLWGPPTKSHHLLMSPGCTRRCRSCAVRGSRGRCNELRSPLNPPPLEPNRIPRSSRDLHVPRFRRVPWQAFREACAWAEACAIGPSLTGEGHGRPCRSRDQGVLDAAMVPVCGPCTNSATARSPLSRLSSTPKQVPVAVRESRSKLSAPDGIDAEPGAMDSRRMASSARVRSACQWSDASHS